MLRVLALSLAAEVITALCPNIINMILCGTEEQWRAAQLLRCTVLKRHGGRGETICVFRLQRENKHILTEYHECVQYIMAHNTHTQTHNKQLQQLASVFWI